MKYEKDLKVTHKFLNENPHCFFVYGDNSIRKGKKGGAILRHHRQAYGFITKKFPSYSNDAYYKPSEYAPIFDRELKKLILLIMSYPEKDFLISQLGGGLANKYHIWQKVICPGLIKTLSKYPNVHFLF